MSKKASALKKLPARAQLPSGRVVTLRVTRALTAPFTRKEGAPLFSEVLALFDEGVVELRADKSRISLAVRDLALGDFHALRAFMMAAGLCEEEAARFPCRNCEAEIRVFPCRALALGPFADCELGEEELDATLPFGVPYEIEDVTLPNGNVANTVTFAARTVAQSEHAFAALGAANLEIDAAFVRSFGVSRLTAEEEVDQIAKTLRACDDASFDSIAAVFLASHYSARLGGIAACGTCGARNDVDAPYERELSVGASNDVNDAVASAGAAQSASDRAFPSLDEFSETAHASFVEHAARFEEGTVDLVIDGGTPACDDGGEPLLGSYVPGAGFEEGVLARPTVTLYFRSFRAMWREDGPYDVDAEIDETVEHELAHHAHFLVGDDPMDDEEREEIAREAVRTVGKKELTRIATRGLGADLVVFARRTWPLWILVALATLFGILRE